jgi:hypothetical protein
MGDFPVGLFREEWMTLRRIELIVIFFSVWILASTLPNLRFAPGGRFFFHAERVQARVSPGMQIFFQIIGICLIASLVILGILLVVSIWKKRRKKHEDDSFIVRENPPLTWHVYVAITLLFIGFGSLIWLSWRHANVFEGLVEGQRSVETPVVQGQHPASPKAPIPSTKGDEIHTVSSLKWRVPLIVVLLILSGLILRRLFTRKPLKERKEALPIIQVVANAVRESEEGREPADIVLRCYRDMCKILGRKVAMSMDLTAREFETLLLQAGVQEKEVTGLTDLFEQVRYGRHLTGPGEQAEALALLKTLEQKYGALDEA